MNSQCSILFARLKACDVRTEARLGRQLKRLTRMRTNQAQARQELEQIEQRIARAEARTKDRAGQRPKARFDSSLPIAEHIEEIAAAIRENQVVVVCGQTGSGKSTQLPLICLEAGRGIRGMIGHTQPRRIAARTIAQRLSQEMDVSLGEQVGYKVRFTDETSPDTFIKVLTDGMLLAEIQHDRNLLAYDTIILDEAHERSLNIDFLLGYLQRLVHKRTDLRVIITSATIDSEKFSRHFGDAPVLEVSGRSYPVEIRYRPLVPDVSQDSDTTQIFLAAIRELVHEGPGDILVFLPGEREIREYARLLGESIIDSQQPCDILPLYARLSAQDQMRAFAKHTRRRIILATNIAETSVTVPGVRFVLDTGLARISRYAARSKVQGLPIEPISKASADQRAGRCGRVAHGVCIRLYSEDDYLRRPDYTDPEVLRSNLAGVILQMKSLQLGEPQHFPFLDRPSIRRIRDGHDTLVELGALDQNDQLTPMGWKLAKIPVDPRLGRMLIAAQHEGALREVLVIASALAVRDPRERPYDQREQADQIHAAFSDVASDFLTLLNIWKTAREKEHELSQRQYRRWCREHFLSWRALREWYDLYRQLRRIVRDMGYSQNAHAAAPEAVHRSLLAGLLCNIGMRGEKYTYDGAQGAEVFIHPGSIAFEHKPRWIVAAEIVRTQKLYARMVAPIRPEWLVTLAAHLLVKSHAKPRWDDRTAAATVREHVSLFGLGLPTKRRIAYGTINPVDARDIFIQRGLVQGRFRPDAAFIEHNDAIITQAMRIESKARMRDHHGSILSRYEFYDTRIPDEVWNKKRFFRWLHRAEKHDPNTLFMSIDDLLHIGNHRLDPEQFPDEMHIADMRYPVEYHHTPGESTDGVTVTMTVEALSKLREAHIDWLIPGNMRERVRVILRGLPKSIRRALGPASTAAEQYLQSQPDRTVPLVETLRVYCGEKFGITIDPNDIRHVELPIHLLPRIVVVDQAGTEIAQGRDLHQIRKQLSINIKHVFEDGESAIHPRHQLHTWDFESLPQSTTVRTNTISSTAYPALADRLQSVSLLLFPSAYEARRNHAKGVRRLLALNQRRVFRRYLTSYTTMAAMRMVYAMLQVDAELDDEILLVAIARASRTDLADIRSQEQYEQIRKRIGDHLAQSVDQTCSLIQRILRSRGQIAASLAHIQQPVYRISLEDISQQCSLLLGHTPFSILSWDRLSQYPRYLSAIEYRIEKIIAGGVHRDQRLLLDMAPRIKRWIELQQQVFAQESASQRLDEASEAYRWMLEEYRISHFAQPIGTRIKISATRLDEQWRTIRTICQEEGYLQSRR